MKRATAVVATAVAMLLVSSTAWAVCTQSDLTGTWRTYQSGYTFDAEGAYLYWQRCTVQFNSIGNVTGGSCVTAFGDSGPLTAGRIRVNSGCVVTGTAGGPGGSVTINQGALDRGKTVFMGVLTDSEGGIASIQGVKK